MRSRRTSGRFSMRLLSICTGLLLALSGYCNGQDPGIVKEHGSENGDFSGKGMLFQDVSTQNYVVLHPIEPLDLQEFTLCLRVSTEIFGKREMILFSYHVDGDELNLWREEDGQLSLYIRGSDLGVKFSLPPLNMLESHLCVTWRSSSGITTFWFNGRRSLSKVHRKGLQIKSGGVVMLGQDQDKPMGGFEAKQCFVGEISDVNLWNRVLPPQDIQEVYEGKPTQYGNILNWRSLTYEATGNVVIRD